MRTFAPRPRNARALDRASASRSGSPLKTTQRTSSAGFDSRKRRIVPPQPISMSSECAPRHSTLARRSIGRAITPPKLAQIFGEGALLVRLNPHAPGPVSPLEQHLESLLVLERV